MRILIINVMVNVVVKVVVKDIMKEYSKLVFGCEWVRVWSRSPSH